jgi:hypothetical protein
MKLVNNKKKNHPVFNLLINVKPFVQTTGRTYTEVTGNKM